MFSEAGEILTLNVRKQLFREILFKNVSWFDHKSRAPGILSVIFSEDMTKLNGLTTEIVGVIAETFFCLAIGVWLSAIYEWRMSLVALATTPLVMIGGILMARL